MLITQDSTIVWKDSALGVVSRAVALSPAGIFSMAYLVWAMYPPLIMPLLLTPDSDDLVQDIYASSWSLHHIFW